MSREIAESVTRNTAVMLGSQIVTWLSSFVLMLFLPRYLGSESYGHLFLAMSTAAISQIVIQWGGHYYLTKHVARSREVTSELYVNSVVLRVVLWFVMLLLTLIFIGVAGYPAVVNILLLVFTISKLWEETNNVLHRCFQGQEMMRYPAVGNMTERVFLTIVAVTALLLGASVVTIGVIMATATLLNFAVCLRFLPKVIPSLPRPEIPKIRGILHESAPYFLWSLFGVIYYRIDAIMLSFMTPDAVVGWYGAAYRFFDIIMFLPSIYNMAIFPVISRLWHDRSDSLSITVQKSLEFILLVGIPLSIGGVLFSDTIVTLFYGMKEFGPTVGLLQIFFVGVLIVYLNFVIMPLIFASDRQRFLTIIAFFAMLLNPAINYFVIPYFQSHYGNGGIGAAFATLVTEYFLLVCSVLAIPRSVFTFSSTGIVVKGVIAGSVMGGLIVLLRNLGVHWILQFIAALAVYPSVLLLLKAVAIEELQIIAKALVPRKSVETVQAVVE